MKNLTLLIVGFLVSLIVSSCEESGNTSLELPFGGRIQNFQSNGITKTDLTSSIWFFENGCVYLVDNCDSFRLGTIELKDEVILFSASSEWLNGDHCTSSEALVDLLKNLSGSYQLSSSELLTIVTNRGDTMEILGSDIIIDPACPAENIAK